MKLNRDAQRIIDLAKIKEEIREANRERIDKKIIETEKDRKKEEK